MYRTKDAADGAAALWLSFDGRTLRGYNSERGFPATDGEWRRVTIIAWKQPSNDWSINPLLRSWGQGSIWFDDFSVRRINFVGQRIIPTHDALIQVDAASQ